MKNNIDYMNSFFQACTNQNISVNNISNEKNTYAYLFDSKGKLYKMYRNLDFKKIKEKHDNK